MRARRVRAWLLPVLLLACEGGSADSTRVPSGRWAGPDGWAEVDAGGARLGFHCAAGEIPLPLRLDDQGRFETRGSYERQAGPEPYRRVTTRWLGRVQGTALTLEGRLEDDQLVQGPLELRLGAELPKLRLCR